MSTIPFESATVMLLRPRAQSKGSGFEVLLVMRHRKSSFVPGYYVFPGGVIDPGDYHPEIDTLIDGIDRAQASRILSDMSKPQKALGAWVAAIRETFEEVGILMAHTPQGEPFALQTQDQVHKLNDYRKALNAGHMSFSRILQELNLRLRADRLLYFSHWITPEPFPQRYDVRFFVAECPEGQEVVCDGVELTGHRWLAPKEALEAYESGQIGMVLPQIMTLVELARYETIVDVLMKAHKSNVPATLTKIVNVDGRDVEVMPDGTIFTNRPPVYS